MSAVADVSREGDGAEALARRHRRVLRAGHERLRRGRRAHRPGVAQLLPARLQPGRHPAGRALPQDRGAAARQGPDGARAPRLLRPRRYAKARRRPTRRTDPDLQRALDAPGVVAGHPPAADRVRAAGDRRSAARGWCWRPRRTSRSCAHRPPEGGRATHARHAAGGRAPRGRRVPAHRPAGGAASGARRRRGRRSGTRSRARWSSRRARTRSKLIVRDAASRKLGSVMLEIEVPPLGRAARLDAGAVEACADAGRRRLVPPSARAARTSRRAVALSAASTCSGRANGADGLPRVKAGHALRRPGGPVLGQHGAESDPADVDRRAEPPDPDPAGGPRRGRLRAGPDGDRRASRAAPARWSSPSRSSDEAGGAEDADYFFFGASAAAPWPSAGWARTRAPGPRTSPDARPRPGTSLRPSAMLPRKNSVSVFAGSSAIAFSKAGSAFAFLPRLKAVAPRAYCTPRVALEPGSARLQQREGLRRLSLLVEQRGQRHQRVRVLRLQLERLAVLRLRLGPGAALLVEVAQVVAHLGQVRQLVRQRLEQRLRLRPVRPASTAASALA